MYYKVIMECGHIGAGNNHEKVWFIKGGDPLSVLRTATRLPGVKKKHTIDSVKLIKEITRDDYRSGLAEKRLNAAAVL